MISWGSFLLGMFAGAILLVAVCVAISLAIWYLALRYYIPGFECQDDYDERHYAGDDDGDFAEAWRNN